MGIKLLTSQYVMMLILDDNNCFYPVRHFIELIRFWLKITRERLVSGNMCNYWYSFTRHFVQGKNMTMATAT